MSLDDLETVLDHYAIDGKSAHLEPLGCAGGFSGARFWRLTWTGRPLCLRCWPAEHPDRQRLQWIHDVLQHVQHRGISYVPVPWPTAQGASLVEAMGHLWELTPWMPGSADYHEHPSPLRLAAALRALARFHVAAASHRSCPPSPIPSPGIRTRLARIEHIMTHGTNRLASSLRHEESSAVGQRGLRLLELFPLVAPAALASLSRLWQIPVPQQPAIRDIWHKHVLLTGQDVTGLIDFGAMRTESVAGDIARLLGTLVRDDPAGWQDGLAAYQAVRPLAPQERMLVSAFDQGNVALSGLQWLDWICIEGRRFENEQGVLERLDESLGRMQHLAG